MAGLRTEKYMENKTVGLEEFFISLKRIELLLEELVFQECLIRSKENSKEANEKFTSSMKNVSKILQEHVEGLPRAQEKS